MNKDIKKGLVPKLRFPEFQNAGNWNNSVLADISTITSGGTPNRTKQEYWNGNIPWITTSLVDFNVIQSANEFISELGLKESSAKIFPKNTILMAMYGQGITRGKVAILGIDAATNQACAAILLKKEINTSFAFQNLASRYDEIRDLSNQGGQENLSGGLIEKIPFSFPTSDAEQTKIAACLSSLDDLITAQTQKIAALKTHKKGLMQQLFPADGETVPKLRFPEFMDSGEWLITPLIEICDVKGGKRIPKGSGFSFEKTGFPYIRVTDMFMGGVDVSSVLHITEDVEKLIKNYKISKEDLFITVAGTIGIVGEIPDELDNANLTENANKIVIKKCCKKYLLQYLSSEYLQNLIASSITNNAQPKLALERIRNFPIPTPCHTEQQKIAACLSSLDELINAQIKKYDALKLHKKGLMQGLFPVSI